jgi:hypothetical protein
MGHSNILLRIILGDLLPLVDSLWKILSSKGTEKMTMRRHLLSAASFVSAIAISFLLPLLVLPQSQLSEDAGQQTLSVDDALI